MAAATQKWSTSWSGQFNVLLERGWKERRHEAFSPLKIGQVVAISIIAGLLWFKSSVSHVQDQVRIISSESHFSFCILFDSIDPRLINWPA